MLRVQEKNNKGESANEVGKKFWNHYDYHENMICVRNDEISTFENHRQELMYENATPAVK